MAVMVARIPRELHAVLRPADAGRLGQALGSGGEPDRMDGTPGSVATRNRRTPALGTRPPMWPHFNCAESGVILEHHDAVVDMILGDLEDASQITCAAIYSAHAVKHRHR